MKAPVLITGAQGFVGRYTIAACLHRWPDRPVVGIGRSAQSATFTHDVTVGSDDVRAPLVAGLPTWDHPALAYRSVDIRDRAALVTLMRDVRPSIVLHLASGLRDDAPSHLFPTNVEGTIALLEAVAESGIDVERVVLGSSGSVYGDAARDVLPLTEDAHCLPADLYAVSKLAAEHAARVIARVRSIPVVAARIFNVVGAGQEERHVVGRIAAQLSAIAIGSRPPKLELGDLRPTRDFIDVRDVASAMVVLAERGESGAYNVGSGRETAIATVLSDLLDIAALTGRVEIVASYARPADLPRYVGDNEKIRALGFSNAYALRESLRDVFGYYAGLLSPV